MRVPQEIVDDIIKYAEGDPTTLCSLCLVSTSFLPKARQVLYHEIRITRGPRDIYPIWSIDLEQATKLFQILKKYNHTLAGYARRLFQWKYPCDSEHEKLMRQALRLMSDSLEILIGNVPNSILSEDHPFRLKSFGFDAFWYGRGEKTQFIASQTSLRIHFDRAKSRD